MPNQPHASAQARESDAHTEFMRQRRRKQEATIDALGDDIEAWHRHISELQAQSRLIHDKINAAQLRTWRQERGS